MSQSPGKKKQQGKGRRKSQRDRGKSRRKNNKCRPRPEPAFRIMENHIGSPGDQQEEDAESEILDDDIAIDDPLDLMNVSPHDMEIGREMRLRGLSDDVLYLQTDPTRLLIIPENPHYNPTTVDIHTEDWAAYDLIQLPDTSVSSCGWNYGARCDFCN